MEGSIGLLGVGEGGYQFCDKGVYLQVNHLLQGLLNGLSVFCGNFSSSKLDRGYEGVYVDCLGT